MALSDISELPETCVVVLSVRASAGAATASFLTSSEREEEVGRLQLAAGSSPVKERQSFLLTKRARLGASAVTLQDHCGRFVGPNHIDAGGPAEADRWVARRYRTAGAHGGVPEAGWEMLSVAVDSRRAADGLADTLAITLLQRGGRSLLGHRAWSLALAAPPVLNLRALRTEGGLAAAAAAPRFDSLGPAARQLVRQVLRAQRDVGAFLVVGHGLSRDLFAACQMAAGSYSWRPNEHAEGSSERDAAFKLNLGLVADQRDRAPPTRRDYNSNNELERMGGGLGPHEWAALALEYFDAAKVLADGLLHILALAAESTDGRPRLWRGAWDDGERFCALRALVYDPGPVRDVTTARHTDATWVTVLDQDCTGGLQVLRPRRAVPGEDEAEDWLDAAAGVAGALIVNTGNILAGREPLFPAVCHRVVRPEGCATRLSLPFFYDRNGGMTGYC